MSNYRKRWRSDGTSYVVEEGSDAQSEGAAPYYMPDISEAYGGGFVSHAGPKPEYITSRKQLRDHCVGLNIRPCGDYKPGEVIAKEKARRAEATRGATGEMRWF
jgi:hypothetical protein